jgi:regulator of protease activity HflC (stomatin/prohibitin superfamily)
MPKRPKYLYEGVIYGNNFLTALCLIVALFFFMIVFLTASIRIVREDARLSVYRLGRYTGDKGPGFVLLIPIVDKGIITPISTG